MSFKISKLGTKCSIMGEMSVLIKRKVASENVLAEVWESGHSTSFRSVDLDCGEVIVLQKFPCAISSKAYDMYAKTV